MGARLTRRLLPWLVLATVSGILLLIPLGYALIHHGASLPVVLTFMLAASGLSIPELVVLSRILRPRLALAFAAATIGIYTALGFGFMSL